MTTETPQSAEQKLHEGTLIVNGQCDNGECWCYEKPEVRTSKEWLTPAQRISRLVGDIDVVLSRINPQHDVSHILKDVQQELLCVKTALESAVETRAPIDADYFGEHVWRCTKHRATPYPTCPECDREATQVKTKREPGWMGNINGPGSDPDMP